MLRTLTLAAIALAALAARADDHGPRTPLLPSYQKECGDCHVAYPPGLLPAASWQRLLGTMDRHFGTNASLDADVQRELQAWLTANAGTGRRVQAAPPEDRITRGAWFLREHDELSAATWKRPAIKSAANCEACHVGAAKGSYSEREIRIPK